MRVCALTAMVLAGCSFAAEGTDAQGYGPPSSPGSDGKQDEPEPEPDDGGDADDEDDENDENDENDDGDDGDAPGDDGEPIVMELCSEASVVIPDPPGVLTDTVIPDVSGEVLEIVVHLDIDHPRTGDLDAELVHGEAYARLFALPDGCETAGLEVTFDDEGDDTVHCAAGQQGVRRPVEPLADLAGPMRADGWHLRLRDREAGSLGRLRSWCIEITLAP